MSNKKEMNLITQIKFAEQTGISRQGISKALKNGLLPYVEQRNKKMIDLNNPAVKSYVKNSSGQREVCKNTPEIKQTKQPKTANTSEDGDDLSPHEINRQTKIADMRKKQMQVEILEKKYLPAYFIEYCYIRYIERLHSTLERSAGVYIQEVGNAILNAGEILPEHIEKFTSLVLEAIHNNKKAVKREVNKYEPS